MPIDLRASCGVVWPAGLCPIGAATSEKESFENWWARNAESLKNLEPRIAEQWVHRHWETSPYRCLPLEKISWRGEHWTTDRLLTEVNWAGQERDVEAVEAFYQANRKREKEPVITMNQTGSWNYPVVVLETEDGVITNSSYRPAVRFWLIEGHGRIKYLLGLSRHDLARPQHDLFILTLNTEPVA